MKATLQVAEDHRHDVDGSAPGIRDVVVAAVDVRAGVVPAAEHRTDGFLKLHDRVGGEIFAQLALVFGLELLSQFLQVGRGQFHVEVHAAFFFHLVDELLEILLADFHDDVREHLDEAAVGVVNETFELRIGVLRDHRRNDFVVQAEVQDGIHHAGHGRTGAGAHGHQQRVLQVAELLAVDLFHLGNIFHDLSHDLVVDLTAVFIVLRAGFGGDGKALRHGKADIGHFGQVGAFAAQKVAHLGIAFREQIHPFLHVKFLLSYSESMSYIFNANILAQNTAAGYKKPLKNLRSRPHFD